MTIKSKAERVVEKFEDLELEICDLRNMCDLASSYMEDSLNGLEKRLVIGEQKMVAITVRQSDLMLFAIYQVEKLAEELRTKFYAIGEGKTP